MTHLRKEKEAELFREFQQHQTRMCDLLQRQRQQKSSDEDERVARAVAEQEAKREVGVLFFYTHDILLLLLFPYNYHWLHLERRAGEGGTFLGARTENQPAHEGTAGREEEA